MQDSHKSIILTLKISEKCKSNPRQDKILNDKILNLRPSEKHAGKTTY